jgi:fumarate reductase flavoprotein subunit
MTGTVLEEGLRGAGGWLLNGAGERFMHNYDERAERATRDIVSAHLRRDARRATPNGGGWIEMAHLGPDACARSSRAWSSAAPTAASTWPAAASRWCRPRTT